MAEISPSPAPTKRRPASLRQEAEMVAAMKDPVGRLGLRAAFHVRRYSALYAVGVLAVIAVLLMPTVAETAHPGALAAGSTNGAAATGVQSAGPAAAGSAGPAAAGPAAGGTGASAPLGTVLAGAGVTRGGFPC